MKLELRHHGSWTPPGESYVCLPAALRTLCGALTRSLAQPGLEPARLEALTLLQGRLNTLMNLPNGRERLEEALLACHCYGYDRTESYLAFIYTTLQPSLTDCAARLLRRLQSREDVEPLAVDLVNGLFTELAEAMLEADTCDDAPRLPPLERTIPWMFQAIRHDVMDHCKSGCNRLELYVQPGPDEGYEQALDRLSRSVLVGAGQGSLNRLELIERREAYLKAFEKAMQGLKPRHREALRLREVESLRVEQMAVRLELSPQQVLDLLQYGREKRAQLMILQFKASPVLADLHQNADEVLALLKRVRLWCLTLGLRRLGGPHASQGGDTPSPDPRWIPLTDPSRLGGSADARRRREL